MTLVVVTQGQQIVLDQLLASTHSLRLFRNNVTSGLTAAQIRALTESSFTEANFSGYAAATLSSGSWTVVTGDPTVASYATQTFTRSSTGTAQTIYGYYVTRNSDSKLVWFEYFPSVISIEFINDQIKVTPRITAQDTQSLTVDGTITIGSDVNLYRNAADVLRTDDSFVALRAGLGTVTAPTVPLHVDSTGQSATIKSTAASNGQHALTAYQAATTGDNSVALNVVSDNPQASAMYLSGPNTQRSTLKITHIGDAGGADSSAAAIGIDLTTAGTAAIGISIIPTNATTGNLIQIRNNGREDFVVKGTGRIGIGVSTGATPSGMVDIRPYDASTRGLFIQGYAAGTDLIQLRDSSAATVFTIENDGDVIIAKNLNHQGTSLGFFNAGVTGQKTVSGSRGGNAALASLLTQLAAYGLIVDSTTA